MATTPRQRLEIGPELGAELRRARGGRSLRATARPLGISHGYLVQLEAGQRAPSRKVAEALVRELKLRADVAAALFEVAEQVEQARRDRAELGGAGPARPSRAVHTDA